MRVLVFGATGRTGSLVVERALEVGHIVTAFTRNPAAVQRHHDRLQTASGDVLDAAAVLRAVEGQDAVISVYGVRFDPLHKITIFSEGTRNLVQSMQHHGAQRYVGVTSGGTSEESQPGSGLVFEWLFKRGIGRTHYADQRRQSRSSWSARCAGRSRGRRVSPTRLLPGAIVSSAGTLSRASTPPSWRTWRSSWFAPSKSRRGSSRAWPSSWSPGAQRSTQSNRLHYAAAGLPSQPEWASAGACRGGAAAAQASKYLHATVNVMEPAIELRSVVKRFGPLTALDNLSLSVQRGEIFGLLGPNGSGKTTLINILSGLSRPTAGQAFVFGYDISRDPRAARSLLGTLPQETALYEELSAAANMQFHADLYNVPRREREARIVALLELVQLTERRNSRVSTFSGGMKRRLALARALLHEPQLLYLDEPTLGVDVQSRRAIWDYILGLKQQGKTVLLTTNYLEEANALCDCLAILDRGRLVAMDTPAALKQRYGDTVIDLELDRSASAQLVQALRELPGVTDLAVSDGHLQVTANGQHALAGQVVTLVTREGELRSISQREPNLDEIFLHLTGSALRD